MERDGATGSVDRRGFLWGLGGAAMGVGAGVLAAPATPAGAASHSVVLTAGAGAGIANRAALQSAIDGMGAGDVLELPSGTYEIDITAGPVWLWQSIRIVGAGQAATILDVLPKTPSSALAPLFDVPWLPSSDPKRDPPAADSFFEVSDCRVDGPTTLVNSAQSAVLRWSHKHSIGRVRLERVTVTGLFDSGVQRSGRGLLEVIDCDINAAEAPVKAFESHGYEGEAACVILRGHHTAFGGKYSSIGIYIHPNVALHCQGTKYEHFNRFAFYANGTPSAAPTYFTVVDVEVKDANLAQTATSGDSMFVRVKHHGTNPGGGESPMKGNVTFVECDLRPDGQYGFFPGVFTRQFISCWIEPTLIFMSAGSGTDGTFRFVDCQWKLSGSARAMNFTSAWSGRLAVYDSIVHGCSATSFQSIYIQGGTMEVANFTVDSQVSNHGIVIDPSVPVTGAITKTATGVCPPSP